MNDRNISVTTALSLLLWIIGGVVILASITTGCSEKVADIGLYVTAAGLVLSVRALINEHDRSMKESNRNAFELGQDSVRSLTRR